MHNVQVNRFSATSMIVFSVSALLMVATGYFQAPLPDEGTAAHIFQLSILALVAALFAFVVTADWTQPLRRLRTLAFPFVTVTVAFAALYYLEHYFYPAHYR